MKALKTSIFAVAIFMYAGTLSAAQENQSAAAAAPSNLGKATEITQFFSDTFGPNPNAKPEAFAVQQAAGSPSRQVNSGGSATDFLLAENIARAWWSKNITIATPNDALLSDGLARYSAALWIESAYGKEAYAKTLRSFVVGALMYGDTPVGQAGTLKPNSLEYRAVVQDKGAEIFHMLRTTIGDKYFFALLDGYYAEYSGKTATLEAFRQLAPKYVPANNEGLQSFFGQWVYSTGIPEPTIEYTVMRTPKGFRVVGKLKQSLETFRFPLDLRIETEGNPENKVIDAVGTETTFALETFGRPKANGITIDPDHKLLIASPALRVLARIGRGELLVAEGKYYDATAEFNRALELDKSSALAHFRNGEVFFYMNNSQAAANEFREALAGNMKDCKWVETWSHIYLGKIFDFIGQRERAVNEYSKALQTKDDSFGAQAEADRYLKKPFGQK